MSGRLVSLTLTPDMAFLARDACESFATQLKAVREGRKEVGFLAWYLSESILDYVDQADQQQVLQQWETQLRQLAKTLEVKAGVATVASGDAR